MKDERNMYNPAMPGMMPGFPNQFPGGPNQFPGYYPGMGVDQGLENRVSTLERQVRRLDNRVTRLEGQFQQPVPTPYQQPGAAPFAQTPPAEQYNPYQSSMQSF